MTEELKQKAIDFIKKTKATSLIRRTREREYRTVSDYSDEELETIYKTEIGLMIGFATENGIHWHGNEEPKEHKEIFARNQQGCSLIANYFDYAWRNVWNGGKIDFEKNIVCWAYVKLPKE